MASVSPGRALRKFKGTATWTGTLKQGKYSYGSVRSAKLRRSFTVSG